MSHALGPHICNYTSYWSGDETYYICILEAAKRDLAHNYFIFKENLYVGASKKRD